MCPDEDGWRFLQPADSHSHCARTTAYHGTWAKQALVVQHPGIEGLPDYDLVGAGLKPICSLMHTLRCLARPVTPAAPYLGTPRVASATLSI